MIPMNIAMILWVWVGRGMFGGTVGLIALISAFTVVPVLAIALSVSTWSALRHTRRQGRLSTAQIVVQLLLWLLLLVIGAVLPDVADNNPEQSVLTRSIGWSGELLTFSFELTKWLAVVAVASWVALMALLARGIEAAQPPR
jgi:hydrogenase/urease accessory protein HupE